MAPRPPSRRRGRLLPHSDAAQSATAPENTGAPKKKKPEDVQIEIGTLAETLDTECPISDPLIEGLVDRGQIATLSARPGTGKTPLLTQVALCCAGEMPFLGLPTRKCRVGIFDLETSPDKHRRLLRTQCDALGLELTKAQANIDVFVRGNPNDANSCELARVMRLKALQRWNWLTNVVEQRRYDLIIIDTLLSFLPFKSTDEGAVRTVYDEMDALQACAPFPAIWFSLHLRKPDRRAPGPPLYSDPHGWLQDTLGSVVWATDADVRLGLEPFDDGLGGAEEGLMVFAGYRRGDGVVAPRILQQRVVDSDGEPVPGCWELVPDPGMYIAQTLSETQRDRFSKLPIGQPLTWSEFEQCTGAPKSSAKLLKDRLVELHLLEYDAGRKAYRRKL